MEDCDTQVQIPEHFVTALRELVTSEFDLLQVSTKQHRETYTREREYLVAERTKTFQAHDSGAGRLEPLKTKQERIAKRLAFLAAQIKPGTLAYKLDPSPPEGLPGPGW